MAVYRHKINKGAYLCPVYQWAENSAHGNAEVGKKAAHNGNVVYTLDFQVTPHQLRHTYITNLIYSGADPKTVQYLAGHKHSKITMDIYAKVKYNKPKELSSVVNKAFAPKKGATPNKTRNG